MGDPIELQSIRSVFAQNRRPDEPLHVTSIKASIGHAEAASGAASLAKLLLMLRHRVIPANISLRTLNPRIAPLNSDGIRIDDHHVVWNPTHRSRVALLNNFGAAGSNCASIIEEAPLLPSAQAPLAPSLVFGMSCKTEEALERLRGEYLDHLEKTVHSSAELADFAYTATARREQFPYKIAVCASNKDDLRGKLSSASIVHASSRNGKVVFIFSGQGSQYQGMGAALYRTSSSFRDIVDHCDKILMSRSLPGVLDIIRGGLSFDSAETLGCWQSATFVLEYALAQLWISWGLKPDAVVGHRYVYSFQSLRA